MREMVADSIGIALSGEAYAVALEEFSATTASF